MSERAWVFICDNEHFHLVKKQVVLDLTDAERIKILENKMEVMEEFPGERLEKSPSKIDSSLLFVDVKYAQCPDEYTIMVPMSQSKFDSLVELEARKRFDEYKREYERLNRDRSGAPSLRSRGGRLEFSNVTGVEIGTTRDGLSCTLNASPNVKLMSATNSACLSLTDLRNSLNSLECQTQSGSLISGEEFASCDEFGRSAGTVSTSDHYTRKTSSIYVQEVREKMTTYASDQDTRESRDDDGLICKDSRSLKNLITEADCDQLSSAEEDSGRVCSVRQESSSGESVNREAKAVSFEEASQSANISNDYEHHDNMLAAVPVRASVNTGEPPWRFRALRCPPNFSFNEWSKLSHVAKMNRIIKYDSANIDGWDRQRFRPLTAEWVGPSPTRVHLYESDGSAVYHDFFERIVPIVRLPTDLGGMPMDCEFILDPMLNMSLLNEDPLGPEQLKTRVRDSHYSRKHVRSVHVPWTKQRSFNIIKCVELTFPLSSRRPDGTRRKDDRVSFNFSVIKHRSLRTPLIGFDNLKYYHVLIREDLKYVYLLRPEHHGLKNRIFFLPVVRWVRIRDVIIRDLNYEIRDSFHYVAWVLKRYESDDKRTYFLKGDMLVREIAQDDIACESHGVLLLENDVSVSNLDKEKIISSITVSNGDRTTVNQQDKAV